MSAALFAGPAAIAAACYQIASKKVLADPTVAPPTRTHSEAIKELIKIVDSVPQLEIPVRHIFPPGSGEYWREITMPAGMTGVGHIHKHRHLNIALTGHAIVTWDGKSQEIKAPAIFYSEPGAQKAFQVFEDLRWVTIHENPNGWTEENIVEIEREIFELPPEMVEAAIPVDDYRMTKRQLPCQD
jgi:quercetin dioxygenase-like cupin family protein